MFFNHQSKAYINVYFFVTVNNKSLTIWKANAAKNNTVIYKKKFWVILGDIYKIAVCLDLKTKL